MDKQVNEHQVCKALTSRQLAVNNVLALNDITISLVWVNMTIMLARGRSFGS